MNIYISGISGTGMGPLALMAKDAGHKVYGSDLVEGAVAEELREHGVEFKIGPQDGAYLRKVQEETPIDWFVYTSALPDDHAELLLARQLGLKASKRDELIAFLASELGLKIVAVAGTHGKTTTTAMLIWACRELRIPASYLVGTTLPFATAGKYTPGDIFFIYEADEYDRNFLHFHPWLSLITTVSYDHSDIYRTPEEYREAFRQFEAQSEQVIHGGKIDPRLKLAGGLRREDATTALGALRLMTDAPEEKIIAILNKFPGAGRRFERIADGVYSDYAHHPEEISATIKMAREEAKNLGLSGVVALYQPHQNTRQHEVRVGYREAFRGVDRLYWLPTYLTREDESLPVITPAEFIADLDDDLEAEAVELNEKLAAKLKAAREDGYLVLLLTAGPADKWYREIFKML